MKQKYLNVTSDDLWRIRDRLDGKESSLEKTYKTNREANGKVYDLNQQASNYLETLALKEVEEQFDRDFDESLKMLSESRARCLKVAETYARIEEDLNEGLRVVRNDFQDTATATLALTCGKNDRGHNEVLYLQENPGYDGGLFVRQGYARRRLRGGRDGEEGVVVSSEGEFVVTDTVRQAELSQGEMYRAKRWLCVAEICCDRVSDIESKRFVSSRPMAKTRLCLVVRDPRSVEISSQSLGSLINLGEDP